MIAVIFELEAQPGKEDQYFDLAAGLKAHLLQIEGFVSIERYQSLTTPGRYLSLSFWQSEEAVSRWRNQTDHRNAQHVGRESIFRDYRLRVARVLRDYGMQDRDQVLD